MNDFTCGKLTALRDLVVAPHNQINRESIARILSECLANENAAGSAGAAPAPIDEIRDFVRQLRDNGVAVDCILRYVGEHFSISYKTIARIIGTSTTSVSKALRGEVRKCLVAAIDNFIEVA